METVNSGDNLVKEIMYCEHLWAERERYLFTDATVFMMGPSKLITYWVFEQDRLKVICSNCFKIGRRLPIES